MTATNQQMTSEQLAELSTLAVQFQAKAEANDDRDTAVMAYAVQKACAELVESRREFTAANATIHNLELKVAQVVAENAVSRNAVQAFCDVVGANTDAICEEVGQEGVKIILSAMKATGNIPATDAYLAEVRAQGVDMFAQSLHVVGKGKHLYSEIAEKFAAQLRQGAKS